MNFFSTGNVDCTFSKHFAHVSVKKESGEGGGGQGTRGYVPEDVYVASIARLIHFDGVRVCAHGFLSGQFESEESCLLSADAGTKSVNNEKKSWRLN